MIFAASTALILLAAEVGRCLASRVGLAAARGSGFGLHLAAGAVGLHLLLLACTLSGVAWSWLAPLVPAALALVALARPLAPEARLGPTDAARPAVRSPAANRAALAAPGWGDLLALAGLAVFTALAAGNWIAISDFVYHWGTKAKRFAIAGGIDYPYLAAAWNWRLHPDYPTLYPDLLSATARLFGRWDSGALQLWSAAFLAGLLAAARAALAGLRHRFASQATVAVLGLGLAAAGIGRRRGGSADWLIAWALVLAVPALTRAERTAADDWQVGLAAALAAASSGAGVAPVRFLHPALLGGPTAGRWRALQLAAVLRSTALPALAILPWLVQCVRWHLFLPTNTGPLDLGRWRVVASAARETLVRGPWLAAPLLLLALPALLVRGRTRPVAAVCLLQLGFYLWIYLSGPVDTHFYVISTLSRLLLHVLPAVVVTIVLALDEGSRRPVGEAVR